MDILISNFQNILTRMLELWPYFVLTIPFAVAINLTGGGEYIKRITSNKPFAAIILATLIGAFSPLCSCGVIPVIASLLLGGVPLAPVMSFLIASPSMDPEIFFLSVGLVGWNMAVWRMVATLIMSLLAGLLTHYLHSSIVSKHREIIKSEKPVIVPVGQLLKTGLRTAADYFRTAQQTFRRINKPQVLAVNASGTVNEVLCCYKAAVPLSTGSGDQPPQACGCPDNQSTDCQQDSKLSFSRILDESIKASVLVAKFMLLAIIIQTLLSTFIPADLIHRLLNGKTAASLITAAVISIPFYTSNLTALPLMSGLIEQGLNPAIALVFLIAGPTTTLPAMAAVWGLVNRRVFLLYIIIPFLTALIAGMAYMIAGS